MDNNKKYELMVIIQPDLTQKKTESELKVIRDHITSHKGSVYKEDVWGVRALAHRIKKHDSGYYAIFYFEGNESTDLKELRRDLNLEPAVMRSLILQIPNDYEVKGEKPGEIATAPEKKAPAMEKTEKAEKAEKKAPAKKSAPKKAAPKAKEEKKEEKEEAIEAIDEKLQSIIDNPDNMDI